MTKAGAIHLFWSSFGLTAYEENAVPVGVEFPYITYELVTDDLGNDTAMTASLWYRSSSWVEANAKAEEIGVSIGYGGVLIPCDGGRLWLRRGNPFALSMGDPDDDMIRRKVLSVAAMYLTTI